MKSIREQTKEAIEKLGYSKEMLAGLLGCSVQSVDNWSKGIHTPATETWEKIKRLVEEHDAKDKKTPED